MVIVAMMKLVVGLGNPGVQYEGTRHNIGFEVVAALASAGSGQWKSSRFEARTAEILIGRERVLLMAPSTYMNLSGRSVQAAIAFYKLPLPDLLIICDDINLPTGRIRLRSSGSAGGQKGLKNIIDQIGSQDFSRLRIGVGRPPESVSTVNYVLQRFNKSEQPLMQEACAEAVRAVDCWVTQGIEMAMTRFNRGDGREGSVDS